MKKTGDFYQLLRVPEWIKNCFVFAGLIFSAQFTNPNLCLKALEAFVLFCLLSSCVYIINDLADRNEDRQHPFKQHRPLASGALSTTEAARVLSLLLPVTLITCYAFDNAFFIWASAYILLNLAYTYVLKHVVIIDILTVALNYVIRIFAGAIAIKVAITPYFAISGSLLALFLAIGKRRHELILLGPNSHHHRSTLKKYSTAFLDKLIAVVTISIVITYCLYTFNGHTVTLLKTHYMPVTIPFVVFGILRYLYLMRSKDAGGNPAKNLIGDLPLLIDVILWLLTVVAIIYTARA